MQGGERHQILQPRHHGRIEAHRRVQIGTAMHHPVTDARDRAARHMWRQRPEDRLHGGCVIGGAKLRAGLLRALGREGQRGLVPERVDLAGDLLARLIRSGIERELDRGGARVEGENKGCLGAHLARAA